MSEIHLSTLQYSLGAVLAGLEGVLALLEQHSERSEACFSGFCLLALVKTQLEGVLADELLAA
ncbi:DUF1484 family protein [Cupriavidus sp. L7L]|uniref:DUF1484 family protein n=1 Tax=Cupriavidus sp. L7L TaxID=2546443 RepID=UPI00105435D1|nr:DUF1484 family protein [Cupriavidus sp. L7L]TDF66629.1 DUF1484 family protein [Cupriavidus sp. L7L]